MCARQFGLSSNPAAAAAAQATNLLYQIERDTQLLGLCARRACALGADCLFEAGARARHQKLRNQHPPLCSTRKLWLFERGRIKLFN